MKKERLLSIIVVTILLVLPNSLTAQKVNVLQSPLWQIKDPASGHISYLFGTFHLFGESWLNTVTQVKDKFLQSKQVIVERNFFLDTVDANADDLKPYDGPPVIPHKIFSDDNYPLINDYLKNKGYGGVDSCFDGNDQPILALMLVYREMLVDYAIGFHAVVPGEDVQDMYFVKEAIALQKNVVELDDRVKRDTGYNKKTDPVKLGTQIGNMARRLKDKVLTPTEMSNAIVAYRDLHYKYNLKKTAPQDFENDGNDLSLRNEQWMEKLNKLLHENNYFIAVGLAHLDFKNGLVNKLRKAGFEVTPVPINKISKQP